MTNEVQVQGKVFKLEANKNGFFTLNIQDEQGQWHNNISLGIKQKPQTFDNGDTISLTYDADNWNNLIGKPELVQKKQAGGNQGGGYKAKGKQGGGGYQRKAGGDDRQDSIIRQSCMGYAATLVAAVAKKTAKPEDLVKETIQLAEEYMIKYASGGKDAVPEIFGSEEKKPAPQQAQQQSQQQAPAQAANTGNDDFDSDVPF